VSVTRPRESAVSDIGTLTITPPKRRLKVFGTRWAALLLLSDLCMFGIAALIASRIIKGWAYVPAPSDSIFLSTLVYGAFWLVIFERLGLYRRSFAASLKDEIYAVWAALALGVVPLFFLFTVVPSVSSSRSVLLLSMTIAALSVGASRVALRAARTNARERNPERIAVIGQAQRLEAVLDSLNLPAATRVLRLVVNDIETTLDAQLGEIGWLRQARAWGAETILLTEVLPPAMLPALLEAAARDRIELAFAPPRLRAHAYNYGLRTDGQQALIVPFRLHACRPMARLTKRALDLTVASVALVLAGPVMLVAALAISLSSDGPVFFRQTRTGYRGRPFDVLKFRTMRVDAEAGSGPVWATARDPRKTRLGTFLRRTSIDELPQIFNVLRGEMSLVGPRPERPVFVEAFRAQLPRYDERHLVRPGISGWSQVYMKRVLAVGDVSEKLAHDLFYLENWTFFMDISVIVKTGFEFLFHRAA
jgi:exopolysaccharide biosynthesis polyprenyl glycosylphosphotransferase